ncbi:MAG: hypothetical protein ABS58_00040 [Mesorhizobium sp. SCN 65-20]|nr:MAG: hypothetical protein ABS58_00040 [Mesorhizobium sp. SCN 65-20]
MKPAALAVAAGGFVIAFMLATIGGQRLAAIETPTVDTIDESELLGEMPDAPGDERTGAVVPSEPAPAQPDESSAEKADEGQQPEQGGLTREAPRAPLSELSLALPPSRSMPEDWKGTTLFHPVASAAGVIEGNGFNVAIAGVKPLDAGESCTSDGQEWNCGARARTAFRGFLRGRSVVCDVPPETERGVIVAKCRIGKQDVGEWLVANGWARADDAGPYAEAGKRAEADKKGIFGPPPELLNTTNLPAVEAPPGEPAIELPAQ